MQLNGHVVRGITRGQGAGRSQHQFTIRRFRGRGIHLRTASRFGRGINHHRRCERHLLNGLTNFSPFFRWGESHARCWYCRHSLYHRWVGSSRRIGRRWYRGHCSHGV